MAARVTISYTLSSMWYLRQFYFWQPDGLRMLGHCFHLSFLFYVAIKRMFKIYAITALNNHTCT